MTASVVSTPPVLIVAYVEFSLHVGVTDDVVPSLQVAVAVYVPVPPSFTDDGPLTAMLLNVAAAGGATVGTIHANAGESADASPVFRTAFVVK